MQLVREMIPDTPKGRSFVRLAWVVGIASIIGIADQLRALFWFVVTEVPEGGGREYLVRHAVMLGGWTLLCWISVLAVRKNAIPPTWALLAIPLMIWTVVLLA
jgi:hypothetical protein